MSAPDRSVEVAAILATLPHAPEQGDDSARRANLYEVGRRLNAADGGNWGVLVKTDQGDKIPADILVWKPTLEHFDVITGDGNPTWIPAGVVTNPAWRWQAIPASGPVPPPPTPPEPPVCTCELEPLQRELSVLKGELDTLKARLKVVEDRPLPKPVEWDVALIGTSRTWGHAHTVTVREPKK